MLNERIASLQGTLKLTGKDIAANAGFSPVVVSHLRSGKKNPKKGSSTLKKYTTAVCRLVENTEKADVLAMIIGTETYTDSEKMAGALEDWLLSGTKSVAIDTDVFRKNLQRALICLNLPELGLAKMIGVNHSVIARLLGKGMTIIPSSSHLDRICTALIQYTEEKNAYTDISRLLGQPLDVIQDETTYNQVLHSWLSTSKSDIEPSLELLLSNISTSSPNPAAPGLSANSTISAVPTEQCYFGTDGLRKAVIRLLTDTAEMQDGLPKGRTKLLLYSDQDMDWMISDPGFYKQWAALMTHCIEVGVQIRIIHNLNRSLPELVSAINSWMPLYLTGMVEPYYNKRHTGDTFSHSFFLCPGVGCIDSYNPKLFSADGIYRYDTEPKILKVHKRRFISMLDNSNLLLSVSGKPSEENLPEMIHLDGLPDVGFCTSDVATVVVKENDPRMIFEFYHPLIKRAFRAYISAAGKNQQPSENDNEPIEN